MEENFDKPECEESTLSRATVRAIHCRFLMRRLGFDPRPFHVVLTADEVALGQRSL